MARETGVQILTEFIKHIFPVLTRPRGCRKGIPQSWCLSPSLGSVKNPKTSERPRLRLSVTILGVAEDIVLSGFLIVCVGSRDLARTRSAQDLGGGGLLFDSS